tara:strand:+ start:358 stop:612 length:255 start_codon:yes stop_codon:yes gene_type:complete
MKNKCELIIINPNWEYAEYFYFDNEHERRGFVDGVSFTYEGNWRDNEANLFFLAPEQQSLAEYNQEHGTDWTIGLNHGPIGSWA